MSPTGFQYSLTQSEAGRAAGERSPSPSPTAPGANSPRASPASTSPRASRRRSPSARSRWRSTACSTDLADPIEHDAKIEFVSRDDSARAGTDPARRRPRAGRSGAGAVAGHAGDHRPGDRERLLLRLLPQRAVHAGGLCRDREEDARDHRARQTLHQGGLDAREDQAGVPRQGRDLQGRAGRRHSRQTSRSRSTSRATGSTCAAART